MNLSRRRLLTLSGSLVLLNCSVVGAFGNGVVVVTMEGTPRGEKVWFAPRGLAVDPGTTISFINRDPANSHTVTAYHPEYFGRVRRIPKEAHPFNSGYLLPDQEFRLTLTEPGVYDYYCVPHEMAAMVGRIVVGTPKMPDWDSSALRAEGVPTGISTHFPSIREILDAS